MEMEKLVSMSSCGSWQGIYYLHSSMILLVPNKRVFQRDLHDDEIEDEIREAFRCFDKEGHGFIPVTGIVLRLAIFKAQYKVLLRIWSTPNLCTFFEPASFEACWNWWWHKILHLNIYHNDDLSSDLSRVLQNVGDKLSESETEVIYRNYKLCLFWPPRIQTKL